MLIRAGVSNSTVQPSKAEPAVTFTPATNPEPQSSETTYVTDDAPGVGVGATSSLVIVPTAEPSAIVAPDGFDKLTVNVSSPSTTASPATITCTICEVTPGANVTTPDAAV